MLTNKYAEGYPGARYYGGCEFYDQIENLAIDRAKQLFGCKFANVQPHSGANANLAAFMAMMKPGDPFIALNLASGGHLSHGMKLNTSAIFYKPDHYELDPKTETIDFDSVRAKAQELKPKMILCGYSAYPRTIDFAKFREIADEVGALLMADIAHIAGLIVGGRASVAVPARPRRHHDHAQNPPRPARRLDPDQRRRAGQGDQPQRLPRHARAGRSCTSSPPRPSRSAKTSSPSSRRTPQQIVKNAKALADALHQARATACSQRRDRQPPDAGRPPRPQRRLHRRRRRKGAGSRRHHLQQERASPTTRARQR